MLNITADSLLARLDQTSILNIGLATSPEPIETTSNGVTRGRALYDTPSPGSQPEELSRSSRKRARTSRAKSGFDSDIAASKQRSSRSRRTRARNRGISSQSNQGGCQSGAESEVEAERRAPSKSPTPIYAEEEPEGQPSREQLQAKLTRKFQELVDNSGTQTLIHVDCALSTDPAYATQPQEYDTEAQFLPPTAVGVGGGFHLDHPTHRPGNTQTYRRSKEQRNRSRSSRSAIVLSTDDEHSEMRPGIARRFPQPSPPVPPQPVHDPESPFYVGTPVPFLGYPTNENPQHPQHDRAGADPQPLNSNTAPPYGIPTSSQSLGDPIPTPALGQGHSSHSAPNNTSQLRAEHSITHVSTSSKSAGHRAPTLGRSQHNSSDKPGSHDSQRSDRMPPFSQPRPRSPSPLPQHAGSPGHLASRRTRSDSLGQAQATSQTRGDQLPRSSTPAPTANRAAASGRATRAKVYGTRLNIIEINSKRLPTAKRGRKSTRGRGARSSNRGRANPAPTPHTRSSSRHQSNRGVCDSPPPDEPVGDDPDLLEGFDDDEHVAEFAAQGIQLPTVSDLHGIERAIWKVVCWIVWAFGAGQGNIQTRTIYSSWVDTAYYNAFMALYPHLAFRPMSETFRTVILNSLSNLRYQDLLRLRESVKDHFKLKNPSNEEERQANEKIVQDRYPNTFHCRNIKDNIDPYEGSIMPRALADTFFYAPTAVGAMYPGLFEKSDDHKHEQRHLNILAYLATMVQFCLEEWKQGYFKQGKLNANRLLSIYICHFDGLKNVVSRARVRLADSYKEWFADALAASQAEAVFKKKSYIQPVTRPEDVRPDSPRHSPTPDNTPQVAPAAPDQSDPPAGNSFIAPATPGASGNPAPTRASSTPPQAGPSCLPARASPTNQASMRYSPFTRPPESPSPRSRATPRPSPSHTPNPDTHYIFPLDTPPPGELSRHMSPAATRNPTPEPLPERDAEGRYTSKAKAKGRAVD